MTGTAPAFQSKQKQRMRIGQLVQRMRQRRRDHRLAYRSAFANGLRARRRKRKAALALSAGVMGFSTAATNVAFDNDSSQVHNLVPGIDHRTNAANLRVSEEMKEALAEEEGVRLRVYRDVAGYPTVGVGHLVRPEDGLRIGDRISYDRAIDFLERDLRIAERAVVRLARYLPLFQHEFDALVDLVYNVGEGNVSPETSPRLNHAIDMGDYNRIAEEMAYHYAGGAKAKGLIYRSERRAKIFLEASYENPREGNLSAA